MADVKWIKIATNIFSDEKIRLIESMPDRDTILIIWFKLLAQAGRCNASGYLILNQSFSYTDDMLATILDRPISTVRMALKTFQQFGMIDVVDDVFHITNWDKHQNIEGMDRIREQNRLRVSKHRENQKLLSSNVTCNVTATESNAIDIDIELDKDKDINRLSNDNLVDESTTGSEIINIPLEETEQVEIVNDPVHESNNDTPPYDAIKDMFLDICTTLPKIKDISGARQKKILTIWRQKKSVEYFRELFERTACSDFLSGRDKKWQNCSFDWIIEPANRTKILEGNYENKGSPGNSKVIQCDNFKQRDYAPDDINKYYANIKSG